MENDLTSLLLTWPSTELPLVYPIVATLVYKVVNAVLSGAGVVLPRSVLTPVAFLHNLVMSVFSGWVFVSIVSFLVSLNTVSFVVEGSCHTLVNIPGSPLRFLARVFLYSKVYEFIDTWIVITKGKTPIFLQTFHHVGAVWVMWILTVSDADSVWIFILLNSFIHTIMYFYYALTTLGYRPSWSILLTSLQILQFILGLGSSIPYFFLPCNTPDTLHFWAIVTNNVYVVALVVLFVAFFRSKYSKKKKKSSTKSQ